MTTQTLILLVSLLCLLAALVLNWGRPGRTLKRQSAGTLTIDLECYAAPAMAELRKVTAALERIAQLQARTAAAGAGLVRLEVKEPRQRQERKTKGNATACRR